MGTRELTVYHGSGKNYAPIPQIILQGRWMEQLGFSIGDNVSVTYQDGKITIEKALNLADGQAYRMFGMVAEQDSPYGKE